MDMQTRRNNSNAVDPLCFTVSKPLRYTDKCVPLISTISVSNISDCMDIQRVRREMWAQNLAGQHAIYSLLLNKASKNLQIFGVLTKLQI